MNHIGCLYDQPGCERCRPKGLLNPFKDIVPCHSFTSVGPARAGYPNAILQLARTRYAGFNDHHLSEKLCEVEGFSLGR
jgi:hypothetical protein